MLRGAFLGIWGCLALVACSDEEDGGAGGQGASTSSEPSGGSPSTSTGDAGSSHQGGTSSQGGAPAGGASHQGGGGAGQGGEGGGPAGGTLRFVALGDAGKGNTTQSKVAAAIKTVCDAAGGCDFALYLGDNIYDSGASAPDDTQFQSKFEQPYAALDFPFHVVLGNHDYGGGGAGFSSSTAQNEIDYTQISQKWSLPSRYYQMQSPEQLSGGPSADFFMLDTTYVFFTGDGTQQEWLDSAIASSTKHWKIAVGHHPYRSNGPHGNAGEYEGIPGIPVISGGEVEDFFDDSLCNKVDVYLCGHDHDRQWLNPACGVELIVSGAGSATTELEGDNPHFYQDDQKGGFLLVELSETAFTGTFYDEDGVLNFTRTVNKP